MIKQQMFAAVVSCVVLLGACGADGAPVAPLQVGAASGVAPSGGEAVDQGISDQRPDDTCGATGNGHLIGMDRDEASQAVADFETSGILARVIGPGIATTRDYRLERINLELGDDGRVARLICG